MTLSPRRKGRLTASNFATAMGIGYSSRQKLWRELTGRDEPFQGNAATEYGTENEPNAVNAYEVNQGVIVQKSGDRQEFVIHPKIDWLGCTPDGNTEHRLVEFKCPFNQMYDDAPAHYIAQTQGQMEITGWQQCDLVAWTPEELKIWRIEYSPEYWAAMFELLEDFWQHVKNDTEPKRRKKPNLPAVNYYELI